MAATDDSKKLPRVFEWNCGPDAKKLIFTRTGQVNTIEYYLARVGHKLYFAEKTIFHTDDNVAVEEAQQVDKWRLLQAYGEPKPAWKYFSLNGLNLSWTYKTVPIMEIIWMSLDYVFELYS
jgi:hypothetical protein